MNKTEVRVPILAYHGLSKKGNRLNGVYTLGADQFETQMAYLSEQNLKTISLERMVKWISGESIPPKSIGITFDDGLESDFSIALPILKRHGFVATFFVNPGTLGTEGHLTVEELRTLHRAGMEIGSHGFDHVFLTRLGDEALHRQIVDSKKSLESILSKPVSFFSIPRGRYNHRILEAIRKGGYRAACTSKIGFHTVGSDLYRLRRWTLRRPYTLDDFISLVEGKPKKHLVAEYVFKESLYRCLGHTLYEMIRNRMTKESKI